MSTSCSNLCVVLVEPKGAGNIGSVARVMKNFGFGDLRLVQPRASHLGAEARNMAVSAIDILERAKVYENLALALADRNLALGTTRRFGKYREELLHPAEAAITIAALAKTAKAAIVFGPEDTGLKTEDLDLCQYCVTIPTHPELPSMNLAQAVAVCLYETSLKFATPSEDKTRGKRPALGKNLEAMFTQMRQVLFEVGFLNPQNPEHMLRAFRRMLARQGLTEHEVQILRGLWDKISWLHRSDGGNK
ncbi:MAG: RNA methyltransferase [Desulfurivibrionaceae bacterium]